MKAALTHLTEKKKKYGWSLSLSSTPEKEF